MPSGNGHQKPVSAFADMNIQTKPIIRQPLEILEVLNTARDTSVEGKLLFADLSYEEGMLSFYNWLTNPEAPNPVER